MGIVVPIFVIAILAFMLAIKYQCSMAETIPVSYMLLTLVLYFFYLLNILLYGYYFVLVAILGGGILTLASLKKKSTIRESLKKVYSPILIVFLIALIATYWYTSGNLIRLWDEQRLWGAYPKALWYTSELQLGKNSWLYEMESGYIPGMPIFVYFFEKSLSSFRENIVFFAYSFWILGLFLPAFHKIRKKRHLAIALLLMLFTPVLFFNSGNDTGNYYRSIFIEPALGMTLAYLVYSMTQKRHSAQFEVLNLCLTSGAIILLKDIGILFSMIVVMGVLGMQLLKKREERYSPASLAIIFLTPLIIYFSWGMITRIYEVANHSVDMEYIQLFDKEFLIKFAQYLSTEPIVKSAINSVTPYLTIVNILCFLMLGNILLIMNIKEERRSRYMIPSISMIVIQIAFLIGLYVLCLRGYHKSILSVLRYESALLLGYFGFLLFIGIDNIKEFVITSPQKGTCFILGIYVFSILAAFPYRESYVYKDEIVFEEANQIAEELSKKIPVAAKEPYRVFLVCDGWGEPLIHQRTYFNLIGRVKIENYSKEGWIVSERYSTNYFGEQEAELQLDKLEKELQQGDYDYIYICKAEEQFIDLCKSFFNNQIMDHSLYRIEAADENVKLNIVNNGLEISREGAGESKMKATYQQRVLDTIAQWGGVILGIGYLALEKELLEERVIVLFLSAVIAGVIYMLHLQIDRDIFREILWGAVCIVIFTYKDSSPIPSAEGRMLVAAITIAFIYLRRRYNVDGSATKLKLIGQLGLAAVIAFQFVGYQFFYKEGVFLLNALRGTGFLLFVNWSYILIGISEMIFSRLHIDCEQPANKKFFYLICAILILSGVIMSVIYYPGIYSADVIACWKDAINIADASGRTDVHSFLYVFVLSLFTLLTRNCYLVTVAFILAYSFVIGSFLYYLYQKGIGKKWILLVLVYFTLFPNNLFMKVALWKDIPFCIAVVSLTHALAKIILEGGELRKIKDIVHFVIAFIAVALFRSNGLAAVALLVGMAIVGGIRKQLSKRCVNIFVLSICLVMAIKIPLYQSLHVKGGPEGFSCIPFMDGIWANVYAGNDISPDTEAYFQNIMPMEEWKKTYISEYCNLYVLPDSYKNKNLDLDSSIKGWAKCFVRNPGTTIGARLIKTDMIWSVFKNEGADLRYNISFHSLQCDNAEEYGWYWSENTHLLRIFFWRYMNYFEKYFSAIYRGGLNLIIWLLIIWSAIYSGKKELILIVAPAIGSVLALLVASCYPDYRYIWMMFLLTPFFILCYTVCRSRIKTVTNVFIQEKNEI